MKALTISEPYASMIANLEKFVENRFWSTPYRGLLADHAGKGTQYLTKEELKKYPTGCIVAVTTLSACVSYQLVKRKASDRKTANEIIPGTRKTWRQVYDHPHTEGPQCWIVENVVKLPEPIPCKGAQGLWELPPEIELLINTLLISVAKATRENTPAGESQQLASPSTPLASEKRAG
jgi:activating signal cointegrator 1